MMKKNLPDYVVVEGPIGVGKTTLAKRLAESFGTEILLEGADENPFLTRFYQDPKAAAFQTQLFFLFQRIQQIQDLQQGDMFRPVRISDFLIEKDRLFARLTLDDEEYRLYEQIYSHMVIEAPVPDLVVYLQAPVDVLKRRIAERGRHYEKQLGGDYLQKLSESYTEFFHRYDASPLLIVNASDIDFANNESDYELLLEQICKARSGRHYFNPTQLTL